MTDTELILSRLDDMHHEMGLMRADMSDMKAELGGRIEAVRLLASDVRDRMDTLEFALQTEISKTYDLAQENALKLSRLLHYKGKIVPMPV